jgi:Tfp pilus assembly protein PilO
MRTSHRKVLIRALEKVAVSLVVLDALLYFALVRPLRALRNAKEAEFTTMRVRLRDARARVAQLEAFQAEVPGADEQLEGFLNEHVPTRRQGFSRAARLVRELVEKSGAQLESISYKLDSDTDDPLRSLALEIDIEGPFESLLDFAHALETGSELAVVRNFNFQPREGGTMGLHLVADLFLKP